MADKLVLLLTNPERRARMGAAALERARAHFTVERMVEETAAVYERLFRRKEEGGRRKVDRY
jgi:glycosyltransferase involved in cell wall biosynthesis